ncbi:MAG TPA: type II and III secretion system protein family protein [Devosiaceae bacterium]|jgi:pilus assembly protein CpaC|nr:type II and III secretion system protein family protein [Devosiaceae bacterium]
MMATDVASQTISGSRRQVLRLAAAAAILGSLLGLAPIGLESAHGAQQASHLRVGANAYGRTQNVEVGLNKSLILDLPADVQEVIVSQPGVANAIVRSKRRAIIQGVAPGGTNIFFLDYRGDAIAVLDVSVGDGGGDLVSTIARVIPGSRIDVQTFDENVVLSGTVLSGDDMQKALAIAAQFAGSPEQVANAITIEGSQQVMLKVTIAEVSRETVKQLGVNLSGALAVGQVNLGFNSTQTSLPNGISGGLAMPNLQIDAAIRALKQRGAVRTLAEPTLTAMTGQTADFFVGGEIPVLSGIEEGVRTFTYREFGVKLGFTPTVKSNGIIGMAIDTEVSELAEGGFDTGAGIIPAINTRNTKTTVELAAGTTLTIAGLFQERVRQQISGLPGLGDIPILGALFRSREFQRNETELVVLVTPYLAYSGPMPELPTDRVGITSDAEAIFLGHMEKTYGVGPSGMRGSYDGSIGFVLD